MIVKLKCISNIDCGGSVSDYLTVGKIYTGVMIGPLFFTETDYGEELIILPSDDAHGKWEVIKDDC